MKEDDLKFLQKLKTALDPNAMTQDDFVQAFEKVLNHSEQTKQSTQDELKAIRELYKDIKQMSEDEFVAVKGALTQLLEGKFNELSDSHNTRISAMEEKVYSLEDGESPLIADIVPEVIKELNLPEQKEVILDGAEQIRDKLETLTEDERLDATAIKGLEEKMSKHLPVQRTGLFGGNARGFQLYVGSTKKGLAQYINLVAGSNMTITDSVVNGLHTITFVSTGGSGFTKLTATETPNGTTKVFTFSAASAQPSFLVVDGAWMQAVTALGTVNWTWVGGATKQATLTIPANDDIYAIV